MSSRLALAMSASGLVVAVLGSTPVGHALASALPRNSVGPPQLKRNAVGPQKIAPNAIRTGHVLDGSLLAADFKAGQIPSGPKGDPGPPGVSERQVVFAQSTQSSSTTREVMGACPAGKVILGGGASVGGVDVSGLAITESRPLTDTQWRARARENAALGTSWVVNVWVVCAKVS